MSQIKYGDHQTGSTYISRSKTDRHAVRTARPGFSGSPDSTDSSPTHADVHRQPKCQMATAKPEVVLFHSLQQIDTRLQRLYLGFRGRQTRRTLSTTPDVDRHPKRKMATAKPEVVLSHVLHQIDTRCERLDTGFRYRPTRRTHRRHPPTSIDSRNERRRPPNRK